MYTASPVRRSLFALLLMCSLALLGAGCSSATSKTTISEWATASASPSPTRLRFQAQQYLLTSFLLRLCFQAVGTGITTALAIFRCRLLLVGGSGLFMEIGRRKQRVASEDGVQHQTIRFAPSRMRVAKTWQPPSTPS
jgi:hypothetical protein